MCIIGSSRRQRERLIHLLEADEATVSGPAGRRRADRDRMIKSFERSAAGRPVSERRCLRPPAVLLETVGYVFHSVLPRAESVGWPAVYAFCVDRLRAVRQDLTVQQAAGPQALAVLRRCALFHLYADYRSRDCPLDVFDRHINTRQLQECLLGVLRLQQAQPDGPTELCERFEAVHLLTSLPHERRMHERWLRPTNRDLRLALEFRNAWELGNFVRACRLAGEMSPLLQLAVYRHLAALRQRGLRVLAAAYGSGSLAVSAAAVAGWLGYDDVTDLRCDVTQCARLTERGDAVFDRKLSTSQVKVPDRGWLSLERALRDPARLLAVCQLTDDTQR
ncbi:SAC3 domain-containing protein 1-like isoform X2 [Amphibalanus amphitrite]|uniref:SAC3 domain-containing protein 1-like isoform X2 n=1 Tax=Amphibalanus amphitrite TaxID=1232801 RepID=UPI001C902FCC|nr:SAC3 domain-containing protein 1-like isoform X2 [Amphibalanus amphitrite]